jgi:predicted transport protein
MPKADDEFQNMVRNLEEKTGKSLDQWIAIAKKTNGTKHGEIVKHLKDNGLTHGYANLVAHSMLQSASVHADEGDLIESQYAGAKAALRPIYEKLMSEVHSFGDDVEVSPKKGYVSLRRKKQFAIVQPSTATRVDVGINLKGTPATERLEASGSFNQMVSHRVRVATASDVDAELVGWLRKAYDAS